MGLIPDPGSLVSMGAARLFQGLRTGDQRALLTGAAIAAFGLWRRSARPKRVLVHRSVVREGSSLVIRNASNQAVEVRRIDGST
ncbi:MAG TPA: hypothetical protein VMS74_13695 [Acidimicrobiia bacterium]|nr:hypothetical protein [Acidimicrobiia bacterium]